MWWMSLLRINYCISFLGFCIFSIILPIDSKSSMSRRYIGTPMKNQMIPRKCSAINRMRKTTGVGIFRDCPTIRGFRKYPSNAWITKSITRMTTTILHPGYSITPANNIGMPPMKIHKIGTKLEKKVIHPRARR